MSAQTNNSTGWVGWGYFASIMMMVLGFLQGITGLAGIFKNNYYVVTQSQLLVFNFKTWGWVNLVIGIIIFMAGLELLRGAGWARVVAIFLAALSLIANMGFINAYPFWSILMIVVDVLVIYALSVHGQELKD
jgi:hypothetical protein